MVSIFQVCCGLCCSLERDTVLSDVLETRLPDKGDVAGIGRL